MGRITPENLASGVAAASGSLPMVCPFAIGKAFGLAAATRMLTWGVKNSVGIGMRLNNHVLA